MAAVVLSSGGGGGGFFANVALAAGGSTTFAMGPVLPTWRARGLRLNLSFPAGAATMQVVSFSLALVGGRQFPKDDNAIWGQGGGVIRRFFTDVGFNLNTPPAAGGGTAVSVLTVPLPPLDAEEEVFFLLRVDCSTTALDLKGFAVLDLEERHLPRGA